MKRVLITGHNGKIGNYLHSKLNSNDKYKLITIDKSQLDLRIEKDVENFFEKTSPNIVINLAAVSGNVYFNDKNQIQILEDNFLIDFNILKSCLKFNVKKLLNFSSNTIYPSIRVNDYDYLKEITDFFEAPFKSYALAKVITQELAGLYFENYGVCFQTIILPTIYGFVNSSQSKQDVVEAMLIKFTNAHSSNLDKILIESDSNILREFLHVRDLADWIDVAMEENILDKKIIFSSKDYISLGDLVKLIKEITRYDGRVEWAVNDIKSSSRRKLSNVSVKKLNLIQRVTIEQGLLEIYDMIVNKK